MEYEFTLPYNVETEIVLDGEEYVIKEGVAQGVCEQGGKIVLRAFGGNLKVTVKNRYDRG